MRFAKRCLGSTAALACTLAASGCGGYDSSGQTYTTQGNTYLAGAFVAGTDSGAMSLSVPLTSLAHQAGPTAAAAPGRVRELGPSPVVDPSATSTVSITGSLAVSGGAASPLSGTYTTVGGILQAATGSSTYTLSGALQGSAIAGTVTGPSGSGPFVAGKATSGNPILVYCGTYAQTGGAKTGRFDVVTLTSTSGLLVQTDDASQTAVYAGPVSLALPAGQIALTLPGQASVYATGSTGSTSITGGTYDDGNGNSGTWSATQCASYTVNPGGSGGIGGIY